MEEIISYSKLVPPENYSNVIHRRELFRKFKNSLKKKIVILSAGTGFGKTTILSEIFTGSEFRFTYLRIDDTDSDIFSFFTYITAALEKANNKIGKSTFPYINSLKNRTAPSQNNSNIGISIWNTLSNEIITNPDEDIYLIIDDYFNIASEEWVEPVLEYIFNNLPDKLHLVLSARNTPQINLSSLVAKQLLEIIDESNFRFKENEFREFASTLYNKNITQYEAEEFIEKTGGWVTGMHLLMQSNQESKLEKDKILYDYIAENIYSKLDGRIKEFALKASYLENFSSKQCNILFGIKDSDKIIEYLSSRNIFIYANGDTYNFRELFKDFLKKKFETDKSTKEKKELFSSIAKYYLIQNENIRAVNFLLEINDFKNALKIITNNIADAVEKGYFGAVQNWLEKIPDKLIAGSAVLLYYKGLILKNFKGEDKEAVNCFKKCIAISKKKTGKIYIKSNTQIAEIFINAGNPIKAIKFLNELLKQKLSEEAKAHFNYWLGVAYYNQSDYEKTLGLMNKAMEISSTGNFENLKREISNILGNVYLIRGEFTKSLFYYESAVEKTENVYIKFPTLTNIVQLYSHSGKFEKAFETLEKAREMKNSYPTTFFKINFILAETHLHYLLGDYDYTISLWEDFLKAVKAMNIKYYSYLAYLSIGYCELYKRNYTKARQNFELAGLFATELNETEKIDFDFAVTVLKIKSSPADKEIPQLEKAYRFFEKNNLAYNTSQSGFQLAAAYLFSGKTDKSIEYLKKSLSIAEENEYISFLIAELLYDRTIFDFALFNKIETDFIFGLFSRAIEIKDIKGPDDNYKLKYEEKLKQCYDFRINFFGEFTINYRGNMIDDDKWLRKVRKNIFAFLYLNRDKHITKEILTAKFYPESTPENSDNIFYQLMSNIRGIFKYEIKSGNKSIPVEAVSYNEKRIEFTNAYLFYSDAEEFEKLYKKAMGLYGNSEDKIRICESAIELYKGDFMEDSYESSIDEIRLRFKEMYLRLLEEVIDYYKVRKEFRKVSIYCDKLIKADNLNEEAYIDFINSELKQLKFNTAKAKANQYVKQLKKETGESPSKEFMKLVSKF